MPQGSHIGYQSLEGESVHEVGENLSTPDIRNAWVNSDKSTLRNDLSGWEADISDENAIGTGDTLTTYRVPTTQHDPPRLQTLFETDNEAFFSSQKQTKQLLRKQFLRWLVTAFFIAMIFLTLEIYQRKGFMTATQKAVYNAIITGLSLGLGLNFFEAFKDLAKVLRWWMLSRDKHSAREVDLILGIENLSKVIKLGYESLAKRRRILFCISWILVILIAQISVALINLTAATNDGRDYNGTYTRPGTVNASNLTCYFPGQTCPSGPPTSAQQVKLYAEESKQSRAHIDGELARTAPCGPYNDIADVLNSTVDYGYFCRRTQGHQEFAYRFSEYNPLDREKRYPFFTKRVITASAGPCFQYHKVKEPTKTKDVNGNLAAWLYEFTNGTFSGNITIPVGSEALRGTTYVYRGINVPQLATTYACGPRCIWMWAHRSFARGPDGSGDSNKDASFQCKVTVSDVANATREEHHVPDEMARLAASAIGLQGRYSSAGPGKPPVWTQYQFYAFGSAWETHHTTIDHVGANMAEFAISSLSTQFSRAPQIQFPGTVPYLGSQLQVFWRYAIPLLVAIAGAHFIIAFSVIWFTRHVIVKDDSNLVVARLMRPITDRLGDSGTLLNGIEISRAVHVEDGLVYGPRATDTAGPYYLDLGTDISPRFGNERHPDGRYR